MLREFNREEEAKDESLIKDVYDAERAEDDFLEVLSELKEEAPPKQKKRDKNLPSSIISD
jgi:hypothetical protein